MGVFWKWECWSPWLLRQAGSVTGPGCIMAPCGHYARGFCSAEVQQRQENECVLVSCPSGLGYPTRPRNLEVFPGSHTRNSRETKDLLQVTQEVCGGAGFLTLNQYPDNQISVVQGEHAMHSGQHMD